MTFCAAFVLGAALCLLYDVFRVFRVASAPTNAAAFVQDVVFFVVGAFATYCLLLARCDGIVRGYALIGEILGFVAFRVTVSRLIMGVAKPIVKTIKKAAAWIKKKILHPIEDKIKKITKKIVLLLLNIQKKIKNLLKLLAKRVYNHRKRRVQQKAKETE